MLLTSLRVRSPRTVIHAVQGLVVGVCCTAGLLGCSSGTGARDVPATDAGQGESSAGEAGNGNYAAFKSDVGLLVNNGGPVVSAPKIVTVTWTADPNEAALEDFGDKLGASAYWKGTLAEYGVGAASSGAPNHVRVSTPPSATLDGSDLDTWVAQQIAGAPANGWPVWDASTIYAVYIPTATKLTPSGAAHSEVVVGSNPHVPYVIIDENSNGSQPVLDAATQAAGHEISEAATNPHVFSDQAVVGFDAAHIAWQMFVPDAEIGDICEVNQDAFFKDALDLPYSVQRLWSNASAAAGHNPCVPAPSDPYYSVAPQALETVSVFVDTAATAQTGLGYRIPIGSQKTFDVGYYSDRPTSGPWTISGVEGNWFSPASNKRLTIAIAKGMGTNGDTDKVTVTANPMSTGAGNAVLLTIVSQAPGLPQHSVPILIATY